MCDGNRLALPVHRRRLAGVGKTGRFLNWQRVHVGAQHDGRPLAVSEQAYDTGPADPSRHLVAGCPKTVRHQFRRAGLLHREFGVRVHVLVERLQIRKEEIEIAQHPI
jgi:hypothetical protein